MKKHLQSLIVLAASVFACVPSFAASTSFGPVSVSASVDTSLALSVVMKKNDFNGATVSNMDFGKLVDIGTGTLRSSPTSTTGTGAVDVFLTANAHGTPYTITQTGGALSNGTVNLPSGACTVVPVYAAEDNGGAAKPSGAAIGSPGSWVSNNKVIYASEAGVAAARTVQAIYSITDDPTAGATTGVPLDQPGGNYNTTVTFTLTTA